MGPLHRPLGCSTRHWPMSAGTSSAGNVRHPNIASVSIGETPEKVRYVALEVLRAVPIAVRDLVVSPQISAGHDWGRTQGIALLADLNDT
jgi:hypothetical protein